MRPGVADLLKDVTVLWPIPSAEPESERVVGMFTREQYLVYPFY